MKIFDFPSAPDRLIRSFPQTPMDARLARGLAALVLLLSTSLPALAASDNANPNSSDHGNGNDNGAPPKDWNAHPPIHVSKSALSVPSGYSPAQIRHAYGIDTLTQNGAGQIIGIVDAYDDPSAAGDLQTFINAFHLQSMHGLTPGDACTVKFGPHPCFQKMKQNGFVFSNGGWALEESLDVQWAHAVAPNADILLYEAQSSSFTNLLNAVDSAVTSGARAVSMSWGGSEFNGESNYDSHFNHAGVSFFASSGDSGNGQSYPAASPYVISVGGTTLPLDSNGNLTGTETTWQGSGGGVSSTEAEPLYQSLYPIPQTNGKRGGPDVAYDANPSTGVSVYDSTPYNGRTGWYVVGGTSAGSPQWAALTSLVDQGRTTPLSTNSLTSSAYYTAAAGSVYAQNFRDITSGTNGSCGAICTAAAGYDFVTGLGSPIASALVPFLLAH